MVVLLNAAAGALRSDPEAFVARVRAALAPMEIAAEVRVVEGRRIGAVAREAVRTGPDVIVAGGGDGTIRSVAQALVGTPVRLAVLPLGTLNHFSKDASLPQELEAALALLATGTARACDVGWVNGRVFLNNSSVGLYPQLVRDREWWQRRHGWGKWRAFAIAFVRVFLRFPLLRLGLHARRRHGERLTPVLFVGNNEYALERRSFGGRARLDAGRLWVYVVRVTSRLSLVRLALRLAFGSRRPFREVEVQAVPEIWIHSRRRLLRVALDGEVERLAPPLHYRVLPGALQLVAPGPRP